MLIDGVVDCRLMSEVFLDGFKLFEDSLVVGLGVLATRLLALEKTC